MSLNVCLATWRTHDAAIGRWWQVDPKAEAMYSYSPFNAMGCNPVSYSDPEGDLPFLAVAGVQFVGSIVVNKLIELFQTKILKQQPQGAVWGFTLHNNGAGSWTRNPSILHDWYWNPRTEQYEWYPGSGEREGLQWYGPNIYLRGAGNTWLYHEQNEYKFTTTYNPAYPASGQLQTFDGFEDPIFAAFTFGIGSSFKPTLGFAINKFDDVVKGVGNIAKNAKKMSPDDIGKFLGAGKDWHKGSAKKDFLKKFKKKLKGDTNADFYMDATTREIFLKSNKSGNWIRTGRKFN